MSYQIGQIVGYVERSQERTIDINACIVDGAWYGVNTEPNQEKLARGEIAAAGLIPYLPMELKYEPHGKRGWRLVKRPMLSSYLFVRCQSSDDHWSLITNARGVHCLISITGKPVPAKDGQVEVIRLIETERYEAEMAHQAERERRAALARRSGGSGIIWHFSAGDRVRIKNGPFAAFYAQLTSAVNKHDRVKAMLQVFGGSSDAELSAFDLEKVRDEDDLWTIG